MNLDNFKRKEKVLIFKCLAKYGKTVKDAEEQDVLDALTLGHDSWAIINNVNTHNLMYAIEAKIKGEVNGNE